MLPEPESLDAIWVNFSDPWPKARHAHRRVIQSAFVGDAARALAPGGHLYVATDDVPYAHQMDDVLSAEPALRNAYAPWPFVFPNVSGWYIGEVRCEPRTNSRLPLSAVTGSSATQNDMIWLPRTGQ